MKKLNDISLFLSHTAQFQRQGNGQSTYESGTPPSPAEIAFSGDVGRDVLLYTRWAGRSEMRKFFLMRRLRQSNLSIEYIYSGTFHIRNGSEGYEGEPGDLFFLHPGMDHDLLFLPENGKCRKFGLIIAGRLLPELLKQLGLESCRAVHLPDVAPLEPLLDRLVELLRDGSPQRSCAENAGVTFQFLQTLSDLIHSDPMPEDIRNLLDFLETHLQEHLTMREIAAMHGMSQPTLNRKFRETMHISVFQHLISLRMHKAENLLCSSSGSIKEIAALCGYNNPLHFSEEFRRLHGCSPREFRRKNGIGY